MENEVLKFKYRKGIREVYPAHNFVSNWLFKDSEEHEAELAHHIAVVAEKNGLSPNDLMHLFPAILRLLKSESEWSL